MNGFPTSRLLLCLLLSSGCSACGSDASALPAAAPEAAQPVALPPAAEPEREPDAGVLDAGSDAAAADAGADAEATRRVVPRRAGSFFEHEDAPIREALANEVIAEVERGGGGRSLSFRVTLADGTRGYFKPAQTFNAMRWQSEIAAYHLDRELGLGRVAPVVGRSIEAGVLVPAAGGDARVDELRPEDGELPGALVWWVPERVVPLRLPAGWERWLLVDGEPAPVTPFQRPGQYRRGRVAPQADQAPEPDIPDRPAELSDMMVFDYLSNNVDRWGTNNTNVRTVGEGGPLMFLDNAGSFVLRGARVPLMEVRLAAVQRFRRSTIDAVRRFDVDRFAERLAADPLAPELDERQLANLEVRRARLLAHVDALIEEHGEDAIYAW